MVHTVCSDMLGYDAVSVGEFLLMFQRIVVPSHSQVKKTTKNEDSLWMAWPLKMKVSHYFKTSD